MADIKADAPYIGEFGDYVKNSVHPAIGLAAGEGYGYGCTKSGFTGLLSPLQKAMDVLSRTGWEAGDLMQRKMQGTYQGLFATANSYAGMDANNANNLRNQTSSSTEVGGSFSRFRPAPGTTFTDKGAVAAKAPEVGKEKLSEAFEQKLNKTKKDSRWLSDSINWFYENFISQNGKGLYDELLTPLTGDFNRIRANGAAWKHAGDMFWQTSENFSGNAKDLTGSHWSEGKAAAAFNNHVDFVWTPVFVVARETCGWMQKGFEALATGSIRLADKCADLIDQVLTKAVEVAAKRLLPQGFAADIAASGWKWVKHGFKLEGKDFPFWGDIQAIWGMINQIKGLYESIEQMVKAADAYYKGFQQVLKTAQQIPDVDSTHKAVNVIDGFAAGGQQMRDAQQQFNEAKKQSQQQLGALERAGGK